jgi:hypothetical protein
MGEGIEDLEVKLELGGLMEFGFMVGFELVLTFFWMIERVSLRNMRLVGLWYPGHWKWVR